MGPYDDLIWIEEAAKLYKRSRQWLDKQIAERKLSVASIPGDRRVYVLRSELDKLLRPQIIPRAEDNAAG